MQHCVQPSQWHCSAWLFSLSRNYHRCVWDVDLGYSKLKKLFVFTMHDFLLIVVHDLIHPAPSFETSSNYTYRSNRFSLCRPYWLWTHSDLLFSSSGVLSLRLCATTLSYGMISYWHYHICIYFKEFNNLYVLKP